MRPSPTRTVDIIAAGEARAREYLRANPTGRRGFVGSDPVVVAGALRSIRAAHLSPGLRFCEWGCGFGIVTAIAADLGFESYGIDNQATLIEIARELAREFSLDCTFVHGTLVPEGGDDLTAGSDNAWWDAAAPDAYEALDLEPDEFDLFYAYPWPNEEPIFEALFARFAADGALLLTYDLVGQLRLVRAVGDESVEEIELPDVE